MRCYLTTTVELAHEIWREGFRGLHQGFGRTPGINKSAGRDHWPHANYAWFAGGGLRMGQVIGATDARAARPKGPSYSPQNVIATLYHVLGIDPETTLPDQSGRPVYLLDDPRPIAELV